jgi:hypothetical protein
MQLNPVHYNKKTNLSATSYNIEENGFIAQEIQKVLPFIVKEGDDTNKLLSVNYTSLIALLTKAVQEQQQQIESMKTEIQEIKALRQELELLKEWMKKQ